MSRSSAVFSWALAFLLSASPSGLWAAHQFQAADGIAHRAAADSKHLHELAFRGKQIARLQIFCNVPFELPGDFLIDLISWD